MITNEHLRKDKALSAWWSSVVNDPGYDKMELILQATIASWTKQDDPRVADKMHGAMEVLDILRNIAIASPPEMKAPSSGIEHEFTKR